jgi:predicted transcriptional regulator
VLLEMAKPKKKANEGTVRLNPELARRVSNLAKLRNKTVDQLIAPFLTPWIETEYRKTLEEEVERERKGHGKS